MRSSLSRFSPGLLPCFVITACVSIPPPNRDVPPEFPFEIPCGQILEFSEFAFPPAGMTMSIREVIAADVNADENLDLVISNAPDDDLDSHGFFVLLGPQEVGDLVYHQFVATNAAPHGMVTRDVLNDDGCLEVAIFGRNKAQTSGVIEIYEMLGEERFDSDGEIEPYSSIPVAKDASFLPNSDGTPVMITFGDFSSRGSIDVAVADLNQLRLFYTDRDVAQNLGSAAPVEIGPGGPPGAWSAINAVFPRPAVDDSGIGDDLLVVELEQAVWLKNDGAGAFGDAIVSPTSGAFAAKSPHLVPSLDGNEVPDVIAGGGVGFGAHMIAIDGSTVSMVARPWNQTFSVSDELEDLVFGDLGGSDLPEVVALDVDAAGIAPAQALLVDSVFDAGAEILPQTVDTFTFVGIEPIRGVATRFQALDEEGPLELWVFDASGDHRCLQRDPAVARLQLCSDL